MLFGLIKDQSVEENAGTPLAALYKRAGNLEKSLESLANANPLTLLTPEQIRTYNAVVEEARSFVPESVALREDAPIIENGDLPHAASFYRIMHTAVVPTLHNAIPGDDGDADLPGV